MIRKEVKAIIDEIKRVIETTGLDIYDRTTAEATLSLTKMLVMKQIEKELAETGMAEVDENLYIATGKAVIEKRNELYRNVIEEARRNGEIDENWTWVDSEGFDIQEEKIYMWGRKIYEWIDWKEDIENEIEHYFDQYYYTALV